MSQGSNTEAEPVFITEFGLYSAGGTHDHALMAAVATNLKVTRTLEEFDLQAADGGLCHPVAARIEELEEPNPVLRIRMLLARALLALCEKSLQLQPEDTQLALVIPPAWRGFTEVFQDSQWWREALEAQPRLLDIPWEWHDGGESQIHLLDKLATRIRNGECQRIIYAAADSLVNAQTLTAWSQARRLMTTENYDGSTPGEAGVSLLLEAGRPREDTKWCARPVDMVCHGVDSESPAERAGVLAQAMRETCATAGLSMDTLPLVVTPFGIHSEGMVEWHYARKQLWPLRLDEAQRAAMQRGEIDAPQPEPSPEPEHYQPALCMGDAGIASLGVYLVIAGARFFFDYPPVRYVLVVDAGEWPWRGAVLLENPRWPVKNPFEISDEEHDSLDLDFTLPE